MRYNNFGKKITTLVLCIFFCAYGYSVQLYWVGGSGNWSNPAKWSTSSGGASSGLLPTANDNVVFDSNSGLVNGANVNIPQGTFSTKDFIVTGTPTSFRFRFISTTTETTMNIHGDLKFLSTHNLIYADNSIFHKWIFHGKSAGSQEIKTFGKNLKLVQFPNDNKEYHLTSDLLATAQIIYKGGDLTTNNFNIITKDFIISNNGSIANSTKIFDAGNSLINCETFTSIFSYSALTMLGEFTIKTEKFRGNSTDNGFTNHINKVILKDRVPTGVFQDYNFECYDCIIDSLIIENTYETYISKSVTISELLDLDAPSKKIIFKSGSNLDNQITIDGAFNCPSSGLCSSPTELTNSDDFTVINKSSGSIFLDGVILTNIHAEGSASFTAQDCAVLESSTGWNLSNSNSPKTYYWKGNSGSNLDWSNVNNWSLQGGSTPSCLPTSIDNVIIDNNSSNGITIQASTLATCNNFTWTKTTPVSMILEGESSEDAKLHIYGNVDINSSATIDGISDFNHQIVFSPFQNKNLKTNGVHLPDIKFSGNNGAVKLLDDLTCDDISFTSGTLITSNQSITASSFTASEDVDKTLNLGSSHLVIDGVFDIRTFFIDILPGTSLIECTGILFQTANLYNLQLNNIDDTYLSSNYISLNKFILNGAGGVHIYNLTTDTLCFNQEGTLFDIEWAFKLTVNEAIISQASIGNPTILKSNQDGFIADLILGDGNFCFDGYYDIQDMEVTANGVVHAPLSIDSGNNTGIDFSYSSVLTPLYWIGNSGEWDNKSNWSNKSGGCPVDKNPNTANKLIFDDNSFFNSSEVITLPLLTNCKTLEFLNSNHDVTFDIQTRLNPLQIFINNAEVKFQGSRVYVQVQTVVENGSVLTLDFTETSLPKLDTPTLLLNGSSELNIEGNSLLIIRE